MPYLTIALTKGRLAYKTLDLFEKVGITCKEARDKSSRKLIFTNEELGLRFFLAKANDVPTYVENCMKSWIWDSGAVGCVSAGRRVPGSI